MARCEAGCTWGSLMKVTEYRGARRSGWEFQLREWHTDASFEWRSGERDGSDQPVDRSVKPEQPMDKSVRPQQPE